MDNVLKIPNSIQAKPIREGAAHSRRGIEAMERFSRESGKPVLVATFPEAKMLRVIGRGVR